MPQLKIISHPMLTDVEETFNNWIAKRENMGTPIKIIHTDFTVSRDDADNVLYSIAVLYE